MSSPTVQTFQPSNPAGGISIAKFVLPHAEGNAAATYVFSVCPVRIRRRLHAEDQHVLRHPALRRARCSTRCAARSTSCPAAHCRRSPSHSTRSRASPGNARCTSRRCTATAHPSRSGPSGAPTECMHGTTRLMSLSISANTGAPIRAMIRIFTTAYAESVSCTPICDIGEPTGPIENGMHIHGPPAHASLEKSLQLLAHHERLHPVVRRPGVVPRKRADERPILHPRHIVRRRARIEASRPLLLIQLDERASLDQLARRGSRTPPASRRPNGCDAGWHRSAIFSTQRIRCLLLVGGAVTDLVLTVAIALYNLRERRLSLRFAPMRCQTMRASVPSDQGACTGVCF